MKELFAKIDASFRKATKGEESINTLIWWWGALSYIFAFFVADRLIVKIDLTSVDMIISVLMLTYFIWHLYALKKCTPKKPQLTKEEKKILRQEARKQWGKKFLRKLFLQEPLTQSNPTLIAVVLDLYCAAHFASYIFH